MVSINNFNGSQYQGAVFDSEEEASECAKGFTEFCYYNPEYPNTWYQSERTSYGWQVFEMEYNDYIRAI